MYKSERKKDILALLREQGFSSTQNLAQQLAVSQTTIYRYLTELEQAGLIRKEYGGVTLGRPAERAGDDADWRAQEHQPEKHDLARRAAALVEAGDTVILDSSTTCVVFAQELAKRAPADVTLITNSARIVLALRRQPEFRVICTGGTYLARHDTLVGSPAEEFVATVTAHKCFVSAYGVTPQACTDSDPADVRVKRLMLARARTKILLADHSKFDRATTFTVATPGELNLIVTDAGTPEATLAPYRALGLGVLSAAAEAA
ncbi:MAG: DeoR/GlpR transcriptional regulator [Anaerolineales bacterium]|nr:DeoR/GlpR transcriptional regulator [Anaerolineales bacterium]